MRRIGQRIGGARSVRAFAVEVLVIVFGVLLALGGQELVNDWTSRQRVAKGEELLRAEGEQATMLLVEEVATTPCVIAQIDRLKAALAAPGPWRGAPSSDTVIGPAVIRAPSRPLSNSAWASLMADGTATHFPSDTAHRTAVLVAQQDSLRGSMEATDAQRAKLNFLVDPVPLDAAMRTGFLQLLGQLRWDTQRQGMKAAQLLRMYAKLRRLPGKARVEAGVAELGPTSTMAECSAQGLPLVDWRTAFDAAAASAAAD